MREDELNILEIECGSIIAPAGFGKTQLIIESLRKHSQSKPILILTHTNAGVAALRNRLDKNSISSSKYCLSTIDGWSIRLASTFPIRSRCDQETLLLRNPSNDYLSIRKSVGTLLKDQHINDIIKASYSRVLVDEYQDCSVSQHEIIVNLKAIIPTCVLGDPLQAIFGFGNDLLPNWQTDVISEFPLHGELATPWRWINASNEELGIWLLEVRASLLSKQPIDLRTAPSSVQWIQLNGSNDHEARLSAARTNSGSHENVLIIGDSKNPSAQRQFASQTPGAVTVEAVDLKDLIRFSNDFILSDAYAINHLLTFAHEIMTNVNVTHIQQRLETLLRGAERSEATKVELSALAFRKFPSYKSAVNLLYEISKMEKVRVHRPAVFKACIRALNLCDENSDLTLHDSAIKMREANRLAGRSLPSRAVGSTLLLKGLEADVVVILNTEVLDSKNFYVAITRGSKRIIICSKLPIIKFSA